MTEKHETPIADSRQTSDGHQIHELKTWPAQWHALQAGHKTGEYRYDDRDFAVGDILVLRFFDPAIGLFDEDKPPVRRRITHIQRGPEFGIRAGFVLLSLQELDDA